MRIAFALCVSLALAACGETTAPPAPEPEAEIAATTPAAPEGEPMSTGLMGGLSTSASGDMAGLEIGRDQLTFSNFEDEGVAVATEYLGVLEPSALIKEGGESFAAAAPSSTATRVEVRRFTGAAPERVCGGSPATYAAIVYMVPLTGLQLMVFTGADAPGPTAHDSEVCGIYAYAVD
ncbi:MAG: hypothetical protein R3C30_12740 [Hyphomonadaceae bacterium]